MAHSRVNVSYSSRGLEWIKQIKLSEKVVEAGVATTKQQHLNKYLHRYMNRKGFEDIA